MRGRSKYYHIVTTKATLARLQQIKTLLGEKGWHVFPVSPPMQRSPEDFIAVAMVGVRRSVLVRPTNSDTIELRFFEAPILFSDIKRYLRYPRKRYEQIRPLRFAAQLPFGDKTKGWVQYIDPKCTEEVNLLFGESLM